MCDIFGLCAFCGYKNVCSIIFNYYNWSFSFACSAKTLKSVSAAGKNSHLSLHASREMLPHLTQLCVTFIPFAMQLHLNVHFTTFFPLSKFFYCSHLIKTTCNIFERRKKNDSLTKVLALSYCLKPFSC